MMVLLKRSYQSDDITQTLQGISHSQFDTYIPRCDPFLRMVVVIFTD